MPKFAKARSSSVGPAAAGPVELVADEEPGAPVTDGQRDPGGAAGGVLGDVRERLRADEVRDRLDIRCSSDGPRRDRDADRRESAFRLGFVDVP